jgi:hypothetical protein
MLTIYRRGIALLFSLFLFACGQHADTQSAASTVSPSMRKEEAATALIHPKPFGSTPGHIQVVLADESGVIPYIFLWSFR